MKKPLTPDTPAQYLKGVGPVRVQQLRRLGIERAGDLVRHYPHDYLEPARVVPLGAVRVGQRVVTRGTVMDIQTRRTRTRGRSIVTVTVADAGATLQLTWFNASYVTDRFREGDAVIVTGEVTQFAGIRQIVSADVELDRGHREPTDGTPVPRYPLTAGLRPGTLRTLVHEVLDGLRDQLEDPLPGSLREEQELPGLVEALEAVHRPSQMEDIERGRLRLAFDEALALQLTVGRRRNRYLRDRAAVTLGDYGPLSKQWVDGLGFALTGAQRRVLAAVARDLRSGVAMHRLVQGDVGCGKTVVAIVAMIWVAEAGGQAAFMAPTEVLARQQGERHGPTLAELGIPAATLTGATPAAERREILEGLRSGTLRAVFGTHALIQDDVRFQRLGLAVVDEQHRFGVMQRAVLARDGAHLLVMSATPIPRSLALTVYGDLDLSVIDEIPPGRTPVETSVVGPGDLKRIYDAVRTSVEAGERAYLVYPLVEESAGSDRSSAEAAYTKLAEGPFAGLRLGLLHGQLPAARKRELSSAFERGELDILVATTVVEVGLDVPEATWMVIHDADRFGLAQLHQLRGRVGRGSRGGRCVLVAGEGGAGTRLDHLARTHDGFAVAEADLRERGMGDLRGTRQHGALPFQLLQPLRDVELLERARRAADAILEADPRLERREHAPLSRWLEALAARSPFWSVSG